MKMEMSRQLISLAAEIDIGQTTRPLIGFADLLGQFKLLTFDAISRKKQKEEEQDKRFWLVGQKFAGAIH